MKLKLSLFAALIAGVPIGGAQAQTKRDMPAPYADGNLHTRNVKRFADDVKASIPFFFMMVISIVLITIFPQIATWLPDVLLNK